MSEKKKTTDSPKGLWRRLSTAFTRALGVRSKRKVTLFIDLSRAATLKDLVYWLQIFFSAGIATLGLVLNSPAVIIGAMLISPLMNPILSSGLALASGNLVLGARAAFNLVLSCAAAISFALLLVVILPFREMTDEIAARTQPNVLDLLIALFSGAVGSVAICREVKGVVTSIPGVAIAVALMPPLCVVGYGAGLIMVFDAETGWRVASGGGLLFLTNLVAITLTAMIVFMILRIDTQYVRERVQIWESSDAESRFVRRILQRFPGYEKAQEIHSLPLRLAMILMPLVLILYPLGSAFSQLKNEIGRKQRESEIRQIVTDIWQQRFQKKPDGATRSTIDQLTISETDGKLNVNLRVFDDAPYTLEEKKQCALLVAERLRRPVETINLKLVEIPTVSILDAIERAREEETPVARPLTVAEMQANLTERVELALADFRLPSPAQIIRKQIIVNASAPLEIRIVYLSDAKLTAETQNILLEKVRQSLGYEQAAISLEYIAAEVGEIDFNRNQSGLTLLGMMQLDYAGRMMRENSSLILQVVHPPQRGRNAEISAGRQKVISDYLESKWQIAPAKIKSADTASPTEKTIMNFQAIENSVATVAPESP